MTEFCRYHAGAAQCANDDLLTGVLRTKWGWDGFVVSDCEIALDICHIVLLGRHVRVLTRCCAFAGVLRGAV